MSESEKQPEAQTPPAPQPEAKKPHYALQVDSARHVLKPVKQEETKNG